MHHLPHKSNNCQALYQSNFSIKKKKCFEQFPVILQKRDFDSAPFYKLCSFDLSS